MPALTGFAPSITPGAKTVNAAPRSLDGERVCSDAEDELDGGTRALVAASPRMQ